MTKSRRMMHTVALVLIIPVLLLAGVVIGLRYVWCIATNVPKAWQIALSIDDSANVALNGRLGQSISSRAAYAQQAGRRWGCILCRLLDDVSPHHCQIALTAKDQNL